MYRSSEGSRGMRLGYAEETGGFERGNQNTEKIISRDHICDNPQNSRIPKPTGMRVAMVVFAGANPLGQKAACSGREREDF